MILTPDQLQGLTGQCVEIAERAGEEILHVYNTRFEITHKEDESPLTEADIAAHQIIAQGLSTLEPRMPIISEESSIPDYSVRATWDQYWLVDPLDGTREFVKRNGEFTVNIALISGHFPILGVVHAPVTGETWYASQNQGSWVKKGRDNVRRIYAHSPQPNEEWTIFRSRSHPGKRLQAFLDRVGPHKSLAMGSSFKICLIAEGKADFYPRLGPTSEWDTAAAHCILREAGGDITDTNMATLQYNTKDSLLNPEFFAFGKDNPDWSQYL